jgi:hypothetical protein
MRGRINGLAAKAIPFPNSNHALSFAPTDGTLLAIMAISLLLAKQLYL